MTYYSELLLVGGSRLEGQERSVVSNLVFPLTVEIVTHDVDKVQVLAELWDVITANQIWSLEIFGYLRVIVNYVIFSFANIKKLRWTYSRNTNDDHLKCWNARTSLKSHYTHSIIFCSQGQKKKKTPVAVGKGHRDLTTTKPWNNDCPEEDLPSGQSLEGCRDSGRQEEPWVTRGLGLSFEGKTQFADEVDVVGFVVSSSGILWKRKESDLGK